MIRELCKLVAAFAVLIVVLSWVEALAQMRQWLPG